MLTEEIYYTYQFRDQKAQNTSNNQEGNPNDTIQNELNLFTLNNSENNENNAKSITKLRENSNEEIAMKHPGQVEELIKKLGNVKLLIV